MSRFSSPYHPARKKLEAVYPYFIWIVFALIFIYCIFSVWKYKELPNLGGFLVLIISGIITLRKKKREHFIDITDEYVEWLLSEEENPTRVNWNDIRWIKKETGGGITLFQESSFSKHFVLDDFPEEDRKQIQYLLQQMAEKRQVRLINFSAAASGAVA
jgi:hypothetical protein